MEINLLELQKALEQVKLGLANKEQLEQTTSFAFMNGKVYTYNGEMGISHPIENLPFTGAVEARAFYKFLEKIMVSKSSAPPIITVEVSDQEIVFSRGRIKAGLALQNTVTLPLYEAKDNEWTELPENFIKFLGFAMSACSDNAATAIYTFVHVNQTGRIEGTDGFRIIQCQLADDFPVKSFLLPVKTAEVLVKMNPTYVASGQGRVHFKTDDDTIISCRISNEPFLNISPLIPKEGVQIILPRTIDKVVDRAMVFAKREHVYDETINIAIQNNRLSIQARCETGWFKEEVNIQYDGEEIAFDIAPYLLKGILEETRGCFISRDKLKFEGRNWLYIASLKAQK